jgi:hypothetical protein
MTLTARPMRRTAALLLAGLMGVAGIAQAKLSAPAVIPAKATYVLSVPDTAAMVRSWNACPMSQATREILDVAGASQQLVLFAAIRPEIEKSLGFSLDVQTITSMMTGVDIFMLPGATNEAKPIVGLVAKIGDTDKFGRFLVYWEKAAAKAAAEAADKDAETSNPVQHEFFTTSTVEGQLVKHFVTGKDMDVYYAQVGAHFLVATDQDIIGGMITRAKGKETAGGFDSATDFDKVEKVLSAHPGVVFVYQNGAAALRATEQNESMRKFAKIMADLSPFAMSGSAVQMGADSIRFYSYAPFAAGSENSLMRKLLERASSTGSIGVLNFAPEKSILVVGTNTFDAYLIYDVVRDAIAALNTSGKEVDLDAQLKELEPIIGFSVKNDLLPALGKEIGVLVDSVDATVMVRVDAAIVLQVRDKDKMQKVLTAVERQITDKLKEQAASRAAKAGSTPQQDITFKTVKEGDVSIKYLDFPPLPSLSPGYAMVGDYLIFASTKETIQKLAAVKDGKEKGLIGSAELDKFQGVTPKGVSFGYVNLSKVWDTAKGVLSQGGKTAGGNAERVLNALKSVRGCASSTTVENGAAVSQGLVLFEPAK